MPRFPPESKTELASASPAWARAACYGGPPGDLYVVLHVKEHPFFEREGNDLHCVVPISFTQAALGAEIQVPTLEGEHV